MKLYRLGEAGEVEGEEGKRPKAWKVMVGRQYKEEVEELVVAVEEAGAGGRALRRGTRMILMEKEIVGKLAKRSCAEWILGKTASPLGVRGS